jgi:HEAT repeat protein
MTGRQLDLFASSDVPPRSPARRSGPPQSLVPSDLGDEALIAAITEANLADAPLLAAEAGGRRLAAAVPALEAVCRRFAGFGLDRAIPEQVTALEALAAIGGPAAAGAVARIITRGEVQGPAVRVAVSAAARLDSELPVAVVMALLRHADPSVRAAACRCVRTWPETIPVLVDLLDDLNCLVSASAACALGRLGRPEARPALVSLLRLAPSPEVIEAVAPVADEDCVVLLARVVRTRPDLASTAIEALDRIDHPRAAKVLAALTSPQDHESDES